MPQFANTCARKVSVGCCLLVRYSMLSLVSSTLSYVWSQLVCLAIDLLLILIVDGISKNTLCEIRYDPGRHVVHTTVSQPVSRLLSA